MSRYIPTVAGTRFGRLVVVKDHVRGQKLVECICDCGKTHQVIPKLLRSGRTRSCGCLRNETTSARGKLRKKPDSLSNSERARLWRINNPERNRSIKRRWVANNPDRVKENRRSWKESNKDRVSQTRSTWRKRRPEFARSDRARRRALEANAVPSWSEKSDIRALYKEARRISAETGIKHDVDHIIPLNHKIVCGLHVLANLQIIPAVENRRKANRFSQNEFP